MKRTFYRDPIQRCQAITQKKKRCTRDATHQHAGMAYCARHHEAKVKQCSPAT